jgi:DNA-binding response OmpR family regulator
MTKKVLIVEDERLIGLLLTKELEKHGYQVCKVLASGEEAVAFAQKEKLDAIVMDVFLTGEMDGIEAAGRIRESIGVPIVFLTCFIDEDLFKRAQKLKGTRILDKFENLNKVHKIIESVVASRTPS